MSNTYPNATHASEHFTWRELGCKCGKCRLPDHVKTNLAKLAQGLEQLRSKVGGPLFVHSGYRCPAHNRAVGGAADSQHMRGTAADITAKTLAPATLAAHAEVIPAFANGGLGRYPGFVHVDIRNGKARW